MTKPGPALVPTQLAFAAGAARSGWWRLGDGPWYGTVVDRHGVEWEIEELGGRSPSWRATSSTSVVVTGASLQLLLGKAIG
jgi:hypothetical protein